MKIKLDENIPIEVVNLLESYGHDVDTVFDEGLQGASDPNVWEAANKDGRFFITQDLDFSDTRKFVPGSHSGIMLIRLSDPSRTTVVDRLSAALQNQHLDEWKRCFVILSDRKIRIRQ